MLYKMANSVPVRRLGHTSSFFFPLATSEALKTGGGVGVEVGVARDQEVVLTWLPAAAAED
jgi:hypothetical protein